MARIPFDSWDGTNDFSRALEQDKLEKHFGPTATAFGTYQAAIASCLEVLGSRTHMIPVVMPITASPDTISGALRAGGSPILLDIRPSTLQLDPAILKDVLEELKAAVVILTRPAGQAVDPELLEITEGVPTILDSRLPPHENIKNDCICSFNIFDLSPLVGSGALVIHKFNEQVRELKTVRNGILGLAGSLPDPLSMHVLKTLKADPTLQERRETQLKVVNKYIDLVKEKYAFPFDQSPEWPYFILRVENSNKVIAHLYSEVELVKPIFPLHLLSDINKRWKEKPEYPVAEGLNRCLIALPTHCGILGKEEQIIAKIDEVGLTS